MLGSGSGGQIGKLICVMQYLFLSPAIFVTGKTITHSMRNTPQIAKMKGKDQMS